MDRVWNIKYKGHQLALSVREAGMESETGVFLATVVCLPVLADGRLGKEIMLEKNYRRIALSLESACQEVERKAKSYVDAMS